jgi:hypothetical protein
LFYILGYSIIKTKFIEAITQEQISALHKGRLIMSLERFISLDMALAMVGYTGHKLFAQLFSPEFSA